MKNIKKLKLHIESMIGDENKVETVMNVAAGVIVKEDENGTKMVLLIQRDSEDHWPLHFEFPRGKCDKGPNEDIHKCLIREVKEETGLDVEIVSFLGKYIYYADKGTRKSICYNYECRMKKPNQKVKLSHEHEGFKWITQAGEAELMTHPDQKRFIQQVLSTDNSIISTPENNFSKNNTVEEYLNYVQEMHPIHRARATKKRIQVLQRKKAECAKTKDPEGCKMRYNKKIAQLQKLLDKLSNLRI